MKNANFIFWRKTRKNVKKKKNGCEHKGVNSIFLWFFCEHNFLIYFCENYLDVKHCCIIRWKIQQILHQKTSKQKYCEKCDFRCFKKGDFDRHLKSKKHNTTNATKIQQNILHYCECGKKYTHRASLFSMNVSTDLFSCSNNFSGKFL